jgi:hypothetical protein
VYFLYLAWRLWKSVVTLAVSGILFPVGFSALQGVSVSEASTAVDRFRRDIRFVSYSGNTPTFCVFPAFGVPVMEKCCQPCGDGDYYFQSCFPA